MSKLEYMRGQISEGFTSGYNPDWELSVAGVRHEELDDISLQHISKLVADGFVEGEVILEHQNKRGWWRFCGK